MRHPVLLSRRAAHVREVTTVKIYKKNAPGGDNPLEKGEVYESAWCDIVLELLRTFRRGSGWWRSLPALTWLSSNLKDPSTVENVGERK